MMASALHFGIQERMPHNELTDELFPHAYTFDDGFMYPGDEPGLGVDIDEEKAKNYRYERACLPVNRKEDGTLCNW